MPTMRTCLVASHGTAELDAPGELPPAAGLRASGTATGASDGDLLSAIARQRSEESFLLFYRRHERRLLSLAWHLTRDAERAHDAFQETMLYVWSKAHRFEPGSAPSAWPWLARILSYKVLSLWHHDNRPRCGRRRPAGHEARIAADPSYQDQGSGTDLLVQLRSELQGLPGPDLRLVGLYFDRGLTQAEIAGQVRLSQRAISHHLQRVLSGLRAALSRAG